MTNKNTSDNFEKGKPYFKHKNAILSAPVRHMFMIATIWYLSHINKNISIMEIGSWFGASALSWAQGLKEYADGKGNLTCIDAWKPFFNLEEHQDNEYVIEMEKLLESNQFVKLPALRLVTWSYLSGGDLFHKIALLNKDIRQKLPTARLLNQ